MHRLRRQCLTGEVGTEVQQLLEGGDLLEARVARLVAREDPHRQPQPAGGVNQ